MQIVYGESKMDGNTYYGSIISQDNARTLAHELGHKAGQYHIYDQESKVSNTSENKDNLFNSGENPNEVIQNNNGTEFKEIQSKDMNDQIRIKYENKQRAVNNLNDKINNNANNNNPNRYLSNFIIFFVHFLSNKNCYQL